MEINKRLESAVPHIFDGLKPVQRRILYAMRQMHNHTYRKVARIVGETLGRFHPHGDTVVADALVQMEQKRLLIDGQGNFGNIFTGDGAARMSYIEARLSKFALKALFNAKVTEWKPNFCETEMEPITLPAKFPLLLAQGAEGAEGEFSSKILSHNFNEICDASIAYLQGKEFALYPDFLTGGYVDVEKYDDGKQGGSIKVRATIEKLDDKTLVIKDVPFGKTTKDIVKSIHEANKNGKIKIEKVDDRTEQFVVEIQIQLADEVSADATIDALYAFTDCETGISPNCCVIDEYEPRSLSVSDVLRASVDRTKELLRLELEIEKRDKQDALLFALLEKIFIEERIYKDKKFGNMDTVIAHVNRRLKPFKSQFARDVTHDEILRLMKIKIERILKFDSEKAGKVIAELNEDIEKINHNINNLTDYTISWYVMLREKYGKNFPRKTIIRI